MGGRIGRWCLAVPGKQPERVAAAVENDTENTVAGGYCGGSGSDHGYGRIARREVVTGVLVQWSGARRRLTGGESKWRWRNSENGRKPKNIYMGS